MPNVNISQIIKIMLIFFSVFLFVRKLFVLIIVEGKSMVPTFDDGDHILAVRYYPFIFLRRGHIVLIDPQYIYGKNKNYSKIKIIKRIVGLPGDALYKDYIITKVHRLNTLNKRCVINTHAKTMKEDYIRYIYGQRDIYYIPPKSYFVRGDNRNQSFDSRNYGAIPWYTIRGLVLIKLSSSSTKDRGSVEPL